MSYQELRPCLRRLCIRIITVIMLSASSAAAQTPNKDSFNFTKVDLDILEQADLLDAKLQKDGLVYLDDALNAYIERIGRSLLPSGETPDRVVWEFRVLRDPLANAFALPNGSVYINTGLLALLENESQLAGVLAHELTHVTSRHSYIERRSYRRKMVAIHIFQAAGAMIPVTSVVGATINVMAGIAPYLLSTTIQGYRRELEQEADLNAVNALKHSDYNPRELASTFELLRKSHEAELIKIYYLDHPKLEDRIAYVNKLTESYPSRSDHSPADDRQRYFSQIEDVARHNVQLDLDNSRYRTALAVSKKLVAFNPESSENQYYLAEAFRSLGPRTQEPTEIETSPKGLKDAQKLRRKMTFQEQENLLSTSPEGRSALASNLIKAEESYRHALDLAPDNPMPHRGLGMLYEKTLRYREAISSFRRYLELQPEAQDRMRILRRIEAMEKLLR